MRRTALPVLLLPALVLLALVVIPARATGDKQFTASLEGFSEVPAISSTGVGEFIARLDKTGMMLDYELTYSGLEGVAQQAHIHLGQAGANGGVSAFLCGGSPPDSDKPPCPPSGTVTGTIDPADVIGPSSQGIAAGEFAEVVAALRASVVYANVHTDKHPGGEIRGQVK